MVYKLAMPIISPLRVDQDHSCRMRCLMFHVAVALTVLVVAEGQYNIQPPDMSRINPEGLRMSIPDEPGVGLFAVHYSINVPVPGTAAGEYNFDVTEPTGDEWVHENTEVAIVTGDTVYFWHYVLHDGIGYQLLEQSWVVPEFTTPGPTPPPTPPPTTTTQGPPPTTTTTTAGPPTTTTTQDPGATPAPTPNPTTPTDGNDCTTFPCLIFEDEFDSLNFDNWQHEITAGGGGNWEFQYYTNNRTNSYVRDGALYIKPTLTDDKYGDGFVTSGTLEIWGNTPASECTGNQWYGCLRAGTPDNLANVAQSARLRSVYGFNVKYGRIDIEAQMPIGDWLWPAIWLLPTHEEYGGWPASGEIDILESRGNLDLKNAQGGEEGHQHVSSAMHWGPYMALNSYELTNAGQTDPAGFGNAFHKYSVEWNNNDITFYIDDVELMKVDPGTNFWDFGDFGTRAPGIDNPWAEGEKMCPFDRPFYLILNVAVGGTNGFFSDESTNAAYPKPWLNTSPTAPKEFWAAKDQWYPTWNPTANNGEDAALKINYIRVYKMSADDVTTK